MTAASRLAGTLLVAFTVLYLAAHVAVWMLDMDWVLERLP
jgi:hypothetical protein